MTKQRTTKHQHVTTGYPPRYKIFEEATGFTVEGRDRQPVFVRLSENRTHFLIADTSAALNTGYPATLSCSLYGYHRLLESVASIAMRDWQRPPDPPSLWSGVRQWAIARTKRALHFRGVYEQWQRLLTLVPQVQRAVAKAVFAATFESSRLGCETWQEIYAHSHLVQDILRYRAAACAVHYAEDLAFRVSSLIEQRREAAPGTYRPGPLSEHFEALERRRSIDWFASSADWAEIEHFQQEAQETDPRHGLHIPLVMLATKILAQRKEFGLLFKQREFA